MPALAPRGTSYTNLVDVYKHSEYDGSCVLVKLTDYYYYYYYYYY